MKEWILTLVTFLGVTGFTAQNYSYTFKVNGLAAGQDVYLANYFGDKLYYYDTTKSELGVAKFERSSIKGGVYAVVLPGPKTFEVILSDTGLGLDWDDIPTPASTEDNNLALAYAPAGI